MRRLVPALLLLALACGQPTEAVYAPCEAGLTLGFENPSLPSPQREEERQQLRVSETRADARGLLVRRTYSSLKVPALEVAVLHRDGGVALLSEGRPDGIPILPQGFPDRVQHWRLGEVQYRIIGRVEARLPGLELPEGSRQGVWVEAEAPNGVRSRRLYLPGIGEAEAHVLRDGQWVCVNRLISRGFTDAPMAH